MEEEKEEEEDEYLAHGVVIVEDGAASDDARGEEGATASARGGPLFDGPATGRAVKLSLGWWVVRCEPLLYIS